jgi:hypothetical protein
MRVGGEHVGMAIFTLLRFESVWVVTIRTVGGRGNSPKKTTIVEMGTTTESYLVGYG